MSSTLTTRIDAVQVDNAGGVRVNFGGKWANTYQVTANGISNIVAALCFARANDVNVLLTLDENGEILGATLQSAFPMEVLRASVSGREVSPEPIGRDILLNGRRMLVGER